MKIAEEIDTYRCIIIYDKTYCIDVFLFVTHVQRVVDFVSYSESNHSDKNSTLLEVPEEVHVRFKKYF